MLYLPLRTVEIILREFERRLQGYSKNEYYLNDFEKVIVIEDSNVLYIGISKSDMPVCLNAEQLFQERKNNPFLNIPTVGEIYYELYIEELSYNTLDWKYVHTKFIREMEKKMQIDSLELDIHYTKFKGYTRLYWCPEIPTLAEKINEQLPELKLKERYDLWEGMLYYFIILEVIDIQGNMEYGVAYTNQKPTSYVISKCKSWIQKGFQAGNIRMIDQRFIKAFESWRGVKRQTRLERYFKYFCIEKYFREKDEVWRYADVVLEAAYNKEFEGMERSTYTKPVNRWKTEEFVLNTVKKLFPNNKVIYQYRPFFLKSKKGGQLSYDIFISGLNVAIEYQGKQHFEAVAFFGGDEAYRRNVERDNEKYDLSLKYDIKLVYINYWETITSQLVREKIEEVIHC